MTIRENPTTSYGGKVSSETFLVEKFLLVSQLWIYFSTVISSKKISKDI